MGKDEDDTASALRSQFGPTMAFGIASLGIAVFSGMDAVVKGLSLQIGVYNTLLWRSLAGVVLSGAIYATVRAPWPSSASLRLHITRGIVSAITAILFFWGLARVPMAQAIALAFIAPLIALFLSAWILKESIGRMTIAGSVIAFGGMTTILVGQVTTDLGADALHGAVAILASACCYALNIVLMRAQALVAGPVELTFWQSLVVLACLALAAPWLAEVPAAVHGPMLLLAAAFTTVSLLLLGWAYRHAPASYLVPTEYTSFIWASLLGWVVFAERLSPWTLAGAMLIVGGCAIAMRRYPAPVGNLETAP